VLQVQDTQLQKSLTFVADMAMADRDPPSSDFAEKVKSLTVRLQNILKDTAEMENFKHDSEMHLDLQVRGLFFFIYKKSAHHLAVSRGKIVLQLSRTARHLAREVCVILTSSYCFWLFI
jgi:hypothetical protein